MTAAPYRHAAKAAREGGQGGREALALLSLPQKRPRPSKIKHNKRYDHFKKSSKKNAPDLQKSNTPQYMTISKNPPQKNTQQAQ
jgi:hypothetical protein